MTKYDNIIKGLIKVQSYELDSDYSLGFINV
jgi:hypothetical protein